MTSITKLKPDVGIYSGRQLLALIDTKWKRLDATKKDNGVSQGDVYQAYAYGKEYAAPCVILLYPTASEAKWPLLSMTHRGNEPRRVDIATVNVADEPGAVAEDLRAALHPFN